MQSAGDQAIAALHFTNSERIQIINMTVRHTGGYAVWFDCGSRDVEVRCQKRGFSINNEDFCIRNEECCNENEELCI